MEKLISLEDVSVSFSVERREIKAVDKVTFSIFPEEAVGILGKSGSGKSTLAHAITRLDRSSKCTGKIWFEGKDLLKMPEKELRGVRGKKIGYVFQDPLSALNPTLTIGRQLEEALLAHRLMSRFDARQKAIELLKCVYLQSPEHLLKQYPHELSGGMRQRVLIAMAISCSPKLLIADEPTTALDAGLKGEILELIYELRSKFSMGLLFISHDLNLLSKACSRILVFHQGKIVEEGSFATILKQPKHPYTQKILYTNGLKSWLFGKAGAKSLNQQSGAEAAQPETVERRGPRQRIVVGVGCRRVQNLGCPLCQKANFSVHLCIHTNGLKSWTFGKQSRTESVMQVCQVTHLFKEKRALNQVSFQLNKQEILGVVGESGSGKSTLAKILLGILPATAGEVFIEEVNVKKIPRPVLAYLVQMVFQDPFSSLNPRRNVKQTLEEPFRIHGLKPEAEKLLEQVQLSQDFLYRLPHELSGGQKQRVGIARALALKPKILLFDECLSSLDLFTQGQILDLLEELKNQFSLTYLFISHDLFVVRQIADRIAVLHQGSLIELGETEALLTNPQHPYTQKLLKASF